MKIPLQTAGTPAVVSVEFLPAPSGNPTHLILKWDMGEMGVFEGVELPRLWFDHSFLKDMGLA